MNTKALAAVACLWVPMAAFAADGSDNTLKLDSLSQKFDKILSTQGISMGGQFRGEFGASVLTGNALNPARRDDEQIGYTSVDFDLRARPNSAVQARAVFRLHLDDASFFGAPYTPFESRWLSIDGSTLDGMLYYHVNNYQQKWSPMTIWSPDPSFVYTPRIFAQQQKQAMDERFLGNDNRNLEGVDVGIRAAVPNVAIDSFNVQLLAAKLLTGAPIGNPFSTFISNSNTSADKTAGYPDSLANFDRWAFGSRGTVTFLKAFNLGLNILAEKDLKSTYGLTDTASKLRRTTVTNSTTGVTRVTWAGSTPDINRDSLAQSGNVYSGQVGADIAKAIGNQSLILGLDGEIASSSWQYMVGRDLQSGFHTATTTVGVNTTTRDTGYFRSVYGTTTGSALNLNLKAGWQTKDWSAQVRVGYLSVDSAYRADLAQTPVFNPGQGRIYNSEQDLYSTNGSDVGLPHYNLFDALYHSVHHWVAEDSNQYAKAPYDKIAYSNYVAGWANYPLGGWTSAISGANGGYKTALQTITTDTHLLDSTLAATGDTTGMADLIATDKSAATTAKLLLYQTVLGYGIDRDLQLVQPGGEASPNRVGPKGGFDANFLKGGVEATATAYLLQEAKGTILDSATDSTYKKAKFQQIQAGVRFRLDRFLPGWNTLLNPKTPLPLELSVSYGLATAKGGLWLDYKSTEIAASAYVGVLPRLSLLGGYQAIQGVDNTAAGVNKNMTDIAGGMEFKIQEGAYFEAIYNLIKTEYPNASEFDFDQSIWSTKISVSF